MFAACLRNTANSRGAECGLFAAKQAAGLCVGNKATSTPYNGKSNIMYREHEKICRVPQYGKGASFDNSANFPNA
jgi:hypothetical protein